jgi:hypothetical protein
VVKFRERHQAGALRFNDAVRVECFHEVVDGTWAAVEAYGECFNAD